MVPSTLGMCRYISHSEIVCRGPKKFENPWPMYSQQACENYTDIQCVLLQFIHRKFLCI